MVVHGMTLRYVNMPIPILDTRDDNFDNIVITIR